MNAQMDSFLDGVNVMDFDDMLGSPTATTTENKTEENAKKICSDTLKSLGFEVKASETEKYDYVIRKNDVQYKLSVVYAEPQSAEYFRIPIGEKDTGSLHIFNMQADCIAFYQAEYDGGSIIQFRLDALKKYVQPIVVKLRESLKPAFAAHNAIEMKRVHYSYRADKDGYDLYLYLPIEMVCKSLKHTKQQVGKNV